MRKYLLIFMLLLVYFIAMARSVNALDWSYIDNGRVKVGVIKDWGASVAYFSRVSPERNVINYFDKGREVQQSYYGNIYGGYCPGYNPNMEAMWNPVQAGDAIGNPSRVSEFINDNKTIYAKIIPRDWCLNNVGIDGYMEEWITLINDAAKIRFKFTYTGSVAQAEHEQETPAMFFDVSLPNSVSYEGSSPWINGALTSILPDACFGAGARIINNPENWAAYVDIGKWGIGVYKPGTTNFVACLNLGDSGPTGLGASYMSTGDHFAFAKGSTYEYDVYLTIGTIDEIRSRFYDIHNSSYADIPEAGLIRAIGDIDVWIVKYIGSKRFKRLILNSAVFNSYERLRWNDIKDAERSVIGSFMTSDLVRVADDPKVYKIYPAGDVGQKRWIITADVFNRSGFNWEAIYEINQAERDSYSTGKNIE